ncbi:MAG: substrate-binding domain-containing protein [Planctomycetota bacterium]
MDAKNQFALLLTAWGVLIACTLSLLGCSSGSGQSETLVLATTTSTRDTGLLDVLLPAFTEKTGIDVKAVAVGSGQALELGRRGDADVLLSHAPAAEEKFMAEGYGEECHPLMYNDFVVIGPESDPAKAKGAASVKEVFQRIAQSKSPFVSRGDQSGTHMKERQLWEMSGMKSEGGWYVQAGAGMAEVLRMANQKRAYTLSDRATFLSQRKSLELIVAYEGDSSLRNHYCVIVVSPQKNPNVRRDAAGKFAEFLLSSEGRKIIGGFGFSQYGQQLFFPEHATDPSK